MNVAVGEELVNEVRDKLAEKGIVLDGPSNQYKYAVATEIVELLSAAEKYSAFRAYADDIKQHVVPELIGDVKALEYVEQGSDLELVYYLCEDEVLFHRACAQKLERNTKTRVREKNARIKELKAEVSAKKQEKKRRSKKYKLAKAYGRAKKRFKGDER